MNYFINSPYTPLTAVPANLYKSFIVRFCWIGEAAGSFKARLSCGFFCAWAVVVMALPVDRRTSSAARGYGSRWQKARATFLLSHPLCADHEARGLVVAATVVDHIVPHRNDQKLFWDKANWQPLCKQCHDSMKQRFEKSGVIAGCTDAGIPIDPNHHWAT